MFFQTQPTIQLNRKLSPLAFIGLVCVTTAPLADECAILNLQKSRSSGTEVSHNRCTVDSSLGLNAILALPAGARFWLESPETASNSTRFQIICQNQSALPLQVKLTSPILPWIEPINAGRCSTWADNRLTCTQAASAAPALQCAIAPKILTVAVNELQLKTSVAMRGTAKHNQAPSQEVSQQWTESIKPDIDLCRKLTNAAHSPITLMWTIKTSGEVFNARVENNPGNRYFADCSLEALQNSQFPAIAYESPMRATY